MPKKKSVTSEHVTEQVSDSSIPKAPQEQGAAKSTSARTPRQKKASEAKAEAPRPSRRKKADPQPTPPQGEQPAADTAPAAKKPRTRTAQADATKAAKKPKATKQDVKQDAKTPATTTRAAASRATGRRKKADAATAVQEADLSAAQPVAQASDQAPSALPADLPVADLPTAAPMAVAIVEPSEPNEPNEPTTLQTPTSDEPADEPAQVADVDAKAPADLEPAEQAAQAAAKADVLMPEEEAVHGDPSQQAASQTTHEQASSTAPTPEAQTGLADTSTLEAELAFYEQVRQQAAAERQAKREQQEQALAHNLGKTAEASSTADTPDAGEKSAAELTEPVETSLEADLPAEGLAVLGREQYSPEERLILDQLKKLGRPLHVRDLEKSFTRQALTRLGGWRGLEPLLDHLVSTGAVIRTRKKTYGLPEAMSLIRGRFQSTASGFGFVIPDSGGEDYFIPENNTLEAWNGDTVLVRMDGRGDRAGFPARRNQRGDGNPRATVIRIVQRAYKQLVGSLGFFYGHPVLKPDDHRLRQIIHMIPEGIEHLDAGARVVAELFWPEQTGEDEVFGHVVRVLGSEDDPETETEAVIVKYKLRGEFPDEVLAQAQAIPVSIADEVIAERLDLRAYNIFTVDGSDAKDFDDAIHIRPTAQGTFEIGVHIADVSHYVQEGTPLDLEAYERATSVYLPGRVLPMLPEHLSNGVCSLVPNQDRLTLSALIELSGEGDVLKVSIAPSVIHSKARLTYDEVQAYSEAKAALPEQARHLEGDMHLLLKMTSKLRQRRLAAGSLDFKLREVKVDIGKNGRMQLIPLQEETARGMIEDLMLLANKAVARFLLEQDIPTLFRVHEEPTLQRFQEITAALARMGLSFYGNEPTPQTYQAMLQKVRGTPRESVVNTLLLRSMQQARYAGENLGHFGLAFEEYLHFTSPIRRYPDLVVHRHVKSVLAGQLKAGSQKVLALNAALPEMGRHTSDKERSAAEAERDLTKYYQCKWAQEHLGESFEGQVSGVVSSGLFIGLENGVEGKLHISHLDDDYYIFLEDAQMLKGRSSNRSYRLGDRIWVTIAEVKPLARQIDFVLADPNDPDYTEGQYTSEEENDMTEEGNNEALSAEAKETKVRARRREDRERERQERLRDLPLNVPKFTLEEDGQKERPVRMVRAAGQGRAAERGGRGPRQERQERRPAVVGAGRRLSSGGGARARIVTVAQSRNEHLRPVSMSVQRMYFGDWTSDNLPPAQEERGGERYARGGQRERQASNRTRGGNDRGAVRQMNGSATGTGSPAVPLAAQAPRTERPSPQNGASATPALSAEEKRRRQRRRRRTSSSAEGAAE